MAKKENQTKEVKQKQQKKAAPKKKEVEQVIQPKIEMLSIHLIDVSMLNPRKIFDDKLIQELSDNIKQQGLLQPITVRPYKSMCNGESISRYEIVCGERRFRAFTKTGQLTIPAIVREMTDEEAFDAMITENLQRKDVEPMDEARAFAELIKRGNSHDDIAMRFGKSVTFILQRLKLNELIPDFIKIFESKELLFSHAVELCKLNTKEQENIYSTHYDNPKSWEDWRQDTGIKIRQRIANRFLSLDQAIFEKSDCLKCQFRCGANMLFSEFEANKCTNNICFKEKTEDHRYNNAVDKANNGYLLLYRIGNDDAITTRLKESGHELLSIGLFSWHYKTGLPDREDYDTEEEYKEEFEDAQKEIKEEHNEFIKDGYVLALAVNNYGSDDELYVKQTISVDNIKSDAGPIETIETLREKDKRNKEIQNENIIKDLRETFRDSNYETRKSQITTDEDLALLIIMIRGCDSEFKKQFGIAHWDNSKNKDVYELCAKADNEIKTKIKRAYIKNSLTSADVNYAKELQRSIINVSMEAYPDITKGITDKHTETYNKRKANIDKQIKNLTAATE